MNFGMTNTEEPSHRYLKENINNIINNLLSQGKIDINIANMLRQYCYNEVPALVNNIRARYPSSRSISASILNNEAINLVNNMYNMLMQQNRFGVQPTLTPGFHSRPMYNQPQIPTFGTSQSPVGFGFSQPQGPMMSNPLTQSSTIQPDSSQMTNTNIETNTEQPTISSGIIICDDSESLNPNFVITSSPTSTMEKPNGLISVKNREVLKYNDPSLTFEYALSINELNYNRIEPDKTTTFINFRKSNRHLLKEGHLNILNYFKYDVFDCNSDILYESFLNLKEQLNKTKIYEWHKVINDQSHSLVKIINEIVVSQINRRLRNFCRLIADIENYLTIESIDDIPDLLDLDDSVSPIASCHRFRNTVDMIIKKSMSSLFMPSSYSDISIIEPKIENAPIYQFLGVQFVTDNFTEQTILDPKNKAQVEEYLEGMKSKTIMLSKKTLMIYSPLEQEDQFDNDGKIIVSNNCSLLDYGLTSYLNINQGALVDLLIIRNKDYKFYDLGLTLDSKNICYFLQS